MAGSVYGNILQAVRTQIQSAGVALDGGIVVRKSLKRLKNDPLPIVIVSPDMDRVEDYTFENQVEITYRVYVAILYEGNMTLDLGFANILAARQAIRRKLAKTTLNGVPEVYDSAVELNPPYEDGMIDKNYEYSLLMVTYKANEPRTE